MDNKKIGLFIANLRKEKNMTQKALAKKLYVSDKAVSKWERGICMPDIGLMEKLAEILSVSVSDILKGEKIEKMTKQSSDEIVKESIPFFQKNYFQKKFIKIITCFVIFITLGYLLMLIIGEFNHGKISLTIWEDEIFSIEVPTFTLMKAKKNTKEYIRAIQNYDYDTIELVLKETEGREYDIFTDWITFEEYIKALKEIKNEGVMLSEYKLVNCYISNSNQYDLDYTCAYDLTFEYQKINYKMAIDVIHSSGRISLTGVVLTHQNYDYWMNKNDNGKECVSIYKMENRELLDNIEKIFLRY